MFAVCVYIYIYIYIEREREGDACCVLLNECIRLLSLSLLPLSLLSLLSLIITNINSMITVMVTIIIVSSICIYRHVADEARDSEGGAIRLEIH